MHIASTTITVSRTCLSPKSFQSSEKYLFLTVNTAIVSQNAY